MGFDARMRVGRTGDLPSWHSLAPLSYTLSVYSMQWISSRAVAHGRTVYKSALPFSILKEESRSTVSRMSNPSATEDLKGLDQVDQALARVSLGERLVLLRRRMGLHQREVASLLNIRQPTLSDWEIGRTEPRLFQALALANLYVVSLDVLVGLDAMPPVTHPRGSSTK